MCLTLDGANGVGAEKVKKLLECFSDEGKPLLCVEVVNDGSRGVLNEGVSGFWRGWRDKIRKVERK